MRWYALRRKDGRGGFLCSVPNSRLMRGRVSNVILGKAGCSQQRRAEGQKDGNQSDMLTGSQATLIHV